MTYRDQQAIELGAERTERDSLTVLVTPEEAARALRIGRTRMYRLIREEAIRSVSIGHSRRVPVAALEEYVFELGTPDRGGTIRALPPVTPRPPVTPPAYHRPGTEAGPSPSGEDR